MSVTIYTAPNCARCTILKEFLASRGEDYVAYDFLADKDIFSAFYREHRACLHRDEENSLEFPIYDDGSRVLQGIGEILAALIAGDGLAGCVGTTGLLHGWISGINVSACPAGEEEHLLILLQLLTKGGLSVHLDCDGRRPELLEKILGEGLAARLTLNILGPAEMYPDMADGPLLPDDMKRSVALARATPGAVIRFLVAAHGPAGSLRISPEQAGQAARWILELCGDRMLPVFIEAGPAGSLPALTDQDLLAYRAKVRAALVRAEINRPQQHR
ncbi:MAG: hypothetical protein HY916_02440 [Desulfovibrio sp.]|nr:hypothetical protein [Desulfovibrio sp.]